MVGNPPPPSTLQTKTKTKMSQCGLVQYRLCQNELGPSLREASTATNPQNYVTASYPIRAFNIYVRSLQTREWGAFKAFRVCCQPYRLYHMRIDLPCPLQSVCQRHALALAPRRVSPLRGRHARHSHVSQADAACQLPGVISQ